MRKRIISLSIISCLLLSTPSISIAGFYLAAKAGRIQGEFAQNYIDQSDVITQNIAINSQQNGYTGGVAVGYQKAFNQYLLGGELSGNLDSHHSSFQSGSSATAFSDSTQLKSHIDFTFVPGIFLTDSVSAYLKIGITYASLIDNLSSPAGYLAVMTPYSANKNIFGFVAGLGISKNITNHVSLFAEGNYRDYGTVQLPAFQNFSASYIHSAHVYASTIEIGAAYRF